jgi:hypothetical protein
LSHQATALSDMPYITVWLTTGAASAATTRRPVVEAQPCGEYMRRSFRLGKEEPMRRLTVSMP